MTYKERKEEKDMVEGSPAGEGGGEGGGGRRGDL